MYTCRPEPGPRGQDGLSVGVCEGECVPAGRASPPCPQSPAFSCSEQKFSTGSLHQGHPPMAVELMLLPEASKEGSMCQWGQAACVPQLPLLILPKGRSRSKPPSPPPAQPLPGGFCFWRPLGQGVWDSPSSPACCGSEGFAHGFRSTSFLSSAGQVPAP